jgi:lysine-N-methylase
VIARRHLHGGRDELVLFDTDGDRVLLLDARAWWVLGEADGTRDLAGVLAAARRHGATWSTEEVAQLFTELDQLGMLVEGAPLSLVEGELTARHRDDRRPIHELPGSRYHCDGRGGCCRHYTSVAFTAADVQRACATAPGRCNASNEPTRVFLPITGSAPTTVRAVMLVDGACAYLDSDDACSLHRAGGIANKPIGCRWFPARIVDDGTELRAAPAIECACPARPSDDGEPLLPEQVRCAADLPPGIVIAVVPPHVRVVDEVLVDRAPVCAELDRFVQGVGDPARACWSWGAALAHARAWVPSDAPPPGARAELDVRRIAAAAGTIAARAAARAEAETLWRGEHHPACDRLRTIAAAAGVLAAPTAARMLLELPAPDPALEQHVLRAAVFVRAWLERGPLALRLTELALQLWIARALPSFVSPAADVTLRETPLAALLGTWRTHGLARGLGLVDEEAA